MGFVPSMAEVFLEIRRETAATRASCHQIRTDEEYEDREYDIPEMD